MNIDLWFYLGNIISQVGIALLAIGLVWVRSSDVDLSVRLKFERRFALIASILLVLGVAIQLHRLFLA